MRGFHLQTSAGSQQNIFDDNRWWFVGQTGQCQLFCCCIALNGTRLGGVGYHQAGTGVARPELPDQRVAGFLEFIVGADRCCRVWGPREGHRRRQPAEHGGMAGLVRPARASQVSQSMTRSGQGFAQKGDDTAEKNGSSQMDVPRPPQLLLALWWWTARRDGNHLQF